jgi:hypothetical protein
VIRGSAEALEQPDRDRQQRGARRQREPARDLTEVFGLVWRLTQMVPKVRVNGREPMVRSTAILPLCCSGAAASPAAPTTATAQAMT